MENQTKQNNQLSLRQIYLIQIAAGAARKANKQDKFATMEYFVNDYTEAINSGTKEDLAGLYFAIDSLGLTDIAKELTNLTEDVALAILQGSSDNN